MNPGKMQHTTDTQNFDYHLYSFVADDEACVIRLFVGYLQASSLDAVPLDLCTPPSDIPLEQALAQRSLFMIHECSGRMSKDVYDKPYHCMCLELKEPEIQVLQDIYNCTDNASLAYQLFTQLEGPGAYIGFEDLCAKHELKYYSHELSRDSITGSRLEMCIRAEQEGEMD